MEVVRLGEGPDVVLFLGSIHGDEAARTPLLERLIEVLRAEPARLTEAGFTFVHPDLASALPAVLAPRAPVPDPQSAY